MKTVVKRKLGTRGFWLANPHLHYPCISLASTALAAVGRKAFDDNSKHLAGVARPAARPKKHLAKAPPTLPHAFQVLGRADAAYLFIFQSPGLVRQVAAPAGLRHIMGQGLHELASFVIHSSFVICW